MSLVAMMSCKRNILVYFLLWLLPDPLPSQELSPLECHCDDQKHMEKEDNQFLSLVGGVIQIPNDYNKNVQPPGNPARVDIGFIVNDILEVNDDEYTVSMKVRGGVVANKNNDTIYDF